jgi:hypothetical protein
MRMRALRLLAALLLGSATAVLTACGADNRIPSGDASQLQGALDQASADYGAGRCQDATRAVLRAESLAVALPSSVDRDLRARLRAGLSNLQERVTATCGQKQPAAPQTQTQTQPPSQSTTTDSTSTETSTTESGTTPTTGTTGTTPTTGTTGTTGTTPTTTGTDTGTGGAAAGGTG